MPRSSYDVVVVGGGHNGLVAAAYSAGAGRSCLLLERGARLGGAAVSEAPFAGVPARVSRYAYLVSLLPRSIVAELGLPIRLASRGVASYTPDPRAAGARGLLVDERDPGRTARSFRECTGAGAARRAWHALYASTRRVARVVFPSLTEPLRSREQLRSPDRRRPIWKALFERRSRRVARGRFDSDLARGIVVLTDGLIGTFADADDPRCARTAASSTT